MRAGCSASTFILVAAWEQSLHPGGPGHRLAHRKGPLNAENAVRTTGLPLSRRNPGAQIWARVGSYRASPRDQASASSKIPIDRWAEHVAERIEHCEYIQRRENVIAVGNSTTGKAHVALGVGLAGCQRGISVCLTTVAALVHELMEAREERRLLSLQRQLSRLNLLIIDELGFVPLSRTGAELLFEVFSQRYERGSIMVTTNLPFDEWTEVFGSERLTGALLDRLTHHVHILEMNGESYRLKHSRDNSPGQAPDDLDNPEAAPEAVLTHSPAQPAASLSLGHFP